MEALRWIFQLYDGISGPAGQMEKSLGGVEKALGALPGSIAVAQQGMQLLAQGAMKLASIAFDGGKFAVDALAFKESTLASFELMLGTKEAAKDMFDRAKAFGKLTPFETTDVIKSFKDLLMAGFKKEEVPILFQAVGDVAAGNNFDKSIMDRLTLVLGQIRGNGKINGGDFIQLTNAGIGRSPIYESIAAMMNVKSTDVADLVSKGKVSADVAIAAVLDAIKARYSGGQDIGQGMLGQATTLKGLFSTLASVPTDLFLDIDLDKSPGFKALKGFTQNLVDALNPDSATGSKLKGVLEGVLNDVGGLLNNITPDVLVAGFGKFVDVVEVGIQGIGALKDGVMTILGPTFELMEMMDGGKEKGEGFVNAMTVLGYVLGGILNVITLVALGVGKAFEGFKAIGDIDWAYLWEQMKDAGADLLKGLANGILEAFHIPVDAVMEAGGAIVKAFKGVLDIHSPSGVFEELGVYTAQGFAQGIDGAGGKVDEAVSSMVRIPGVGGGGGAAPTINLTVQVDGAGKDAEELARRIAELLPTQLASAFEQMAVEGGVG